MSGTRKIFKSSVTSQHAVREVLSMVFAQEVLTPSRDVFIVAPWISNIVIFDSRLGQYSTLNPQWAKREIRLVEVLVAIATNGTALHIHTRPDDHNKRFKRRITEAMTDAGLFDQLRWADRNANLHTKGVLTDRVLIDGSMNLTESGVALNDEAVTVSFAPEQIATARMHFELYGHP
ncbi:MAG: phospholipase D-like domain-containing protein DpdK [Oxalobacteraceae bacterium]|nr:phospholipase D-like domain-containing protein DpdK [Oxalobacteraceae bacterium]